MALQQWSKGSPFLNSRVWQLMTEFWVQNITSKSNGRSHITSITQSLITTIPSGKWFLSTAILAISVGANEKLFQNGAFLVTDWRTMTGMVWMERKRWIIVGRGKVCAVIWRKEKETLHNEWLWPFDCCSFHLSWQRKWKVCWEIKNDAFWRLSWAKICFLCKKCNGLWFGND